MEGIKMGKKISEAAKLNAMVAEARIARVVEEENQVAQKDNSIATLRAETNTKLAEMLKCREIGDEPTRRELRNQVVVDNLRLVTHVLSKYGYFSPDKFQNGCIGLLKAAETFNIEKGVPFHNYAAFCIETEVRLAFRRVNRAFEGKSEGFLDSLDAPSALSNGDQLDRHESIADPYSEVEFDEFIDEAEVDTLFYDIIIPVIEQYGTRAKDIDMELWQRLEIQYFIELSMEQSQRQRITFTEMAAQLGSTPQNMRSRHKKVMELVREACIEAGYCMERTKSGAARFYYNDEVNDDTYDVRRKGKKYKGR
jgi:RNA polymerase sigma factor (sigma-70 family)